jgi:Lon protease-like protein
VILEVPLFPLNTVLFPAGTLPLRIFEARYMDMATACIRDNLPFGVCLIEKGNETGAPAEPHGFGTLARIGDWDMPQTGILNVSTRGEDRFRILARRTTSAGLQHAEIEPVAEPATQEVPERFARLVPLLRVIVADLGDQAPPLPHRFYDATWVGYRYSEVLPIPNAARQKLLELEDSISRLEILYRFLEQKKLIVD